MKKGYHNYNKKSIEAVSKGNYLRNQIVVNASNVQPQKMIDILKSTIYGPKGRTYYYIQQQQLQIQQSITAQNLQISLVRIYCSDNSYKINSHSFVNQYKLKQGTVIKQQFQFQQLIDIIIIQKSHQQSPELQTNQSLLIKTSTTGSGTQNESRDFKNYQAYIVHFSYNQKQAQQVKWDIFVEKFQFIKLNRQNHNGLDGQKYKICYSMIFSYNGQEKEASSSIFSLFLYQNPIKKFILNYFDSINGNLQRLKKLQGYLFHLNRLKQQSKSLQESTKTLPCYSLQLKRQRNISAQYFMEYKKLKQKMIHSYISINQQLINIGEIKDAQMKVQNAICRFLIEHNYNFQKVKKLLSHLFNWQYQLKMNFKMSNFKYWTDQNFLIRIGFDRIGRPVFLFNSQNFLSKNVNNVDDYINFLFYFVLIQSFGLCRGYVDELILLADCTNTTLKNLHVEAHKKSIVTALQFCPRACFKIILYQCSALHYYSYKLFEPVLPTYANQIVRMYKAGNEHQALEQCLRYMDIEVIPKNIGGKNNICQDSSSH